MSALILATVAGGVAYMIGSEMQQQGDEKKKVKVETAMQFPQHTGTYGNNNDISEILNDPNYFREVALDHDLSGVQCYHVKTRTGGSYRVYNKQIFNF